MDERDSNDRGRRQGVMRGRRHVSVCVRVSLCVDAHMKKSLIATKTELKDVLPFHSAKLNRGALTMLSTSNLTLPASITFNIFIYATNPEGCDDYCN